MIFKKAISPVVAIALLLVVSVVAVVGFQQWYQSYQSTLFVDTEQKSSASAGISIEYITDDGIMYVNNRGSSESILDKVEISGIDCPIDQEIEPGITSIPIGTCLNQSGSNDIVIITDSGIFEEEVFIKTLDILDCSSLDGGVWIKVPGNVHFGTKDFCVMKYEAKNNSNLALSQPSGDFFVNTTYYVSSDACTGLGEGYKIITNREWMTIARNIEQISANWNSSVVGSGFIYSGHNDNDPVGLQNSSSNDNDGYYSTNNLTGSNQKRTLILSNGEIIWDFAGNVLEYVDALENGANAQGDVCGSYTYYDFDNCPWVSPYAKTEASDVRFEVGPLGDYNSSHGIGNILGKTGVSGLFRRGGFSGGGSTISGIYHLNVKIGPTYQNPIVGFRCTYTN